MVQNLGQTPLPGECGDRSNLFYMDETKDLFPSAQLSRLLTFDQIERIEHNSPIAITTSISFLPFPKLDWGTRCDRALTDSDMSMTIAELRPSHVDTHGPYTELFFSLGHVRLPCI